MTQQSMKGLFKGLRFISQVFDEKEDEEIQIGFPTDVKHVAHIGCDDSSTKAPDWMNEFKQPSEGQVNRDANSAPTSSNTQVQQDTTVTKAESGNNNPSGSPTARAAAKSKKAKQSKQSSDAIDSTTTSKPRRAKQPSIDSACPEQMDQEGVEPNNGEDLTKVPRKTNKKKTKDRSSEGTSKTTKTRRGKAKTDSNIITDMLPRSKTLQEEDESK